MQIIPLTPTYYPQGAALLEAAFPQAYAGQGMEEMEKLADAERVLLGAVDGPVLLGLVGAIPQYGVTAWELHPLVVLASHRTGGIGSALCAALEDVLRKKGCLTVYLGSDDEDCSTSLSHGDLFQDTFGKIQSIKNLKNHPFGFYQKIGYQIVGVIPNANGLGKPDIWMAKSMLPQCILALEDLGFSNLSFWRFYFYTSFPNALDAKHDLSLGEILQQNHLLYDKDWANKFTQYYDGVLEESDGYLDNPTTLCTSLPHGETLKIEFHPGDILFFLDDVEIGCIGPHDALYSLPYSKLADLLTCENGHQLFLLLLPLGHVLPEEMSTVTQTLAGVIAKLFPSELCQVMADAIVYGLTKHPQ